MIKFSRQANLHFRLIGQLDRRTRRQVRNALHEVGAGAEAWTKTRLTTGRRTGRFYRYRGRRIQASSPGEFPAKRSGNLARSVRYIVSSTRQMELGAGPIDGEAPYPKFLEGGTRKMRPRPYLKRASDQFAQTLARLLFKFGLAAIEKRTD